MISNEKATEAAFRSSMNHLKRKRRFLQTGGTEQFDCMQEVLNDDFVYNVDKTVHEGFSFKLNRFKKNRE